MNVTESQARQQRIDPSLERGGWTLMRFPSSAKPPHGIAVEEFHTTAGPADYVLEADGTPTAVVEANLQLADALSWKLEAAERSLGRSSQVVLAKSLRGGLVTNEVQ